MRQIPLLRTFFLAAGAQLFQAQSLRHLKAACRPRLAWWESESCYPDPTIASMSCLHRHRSRSFPAGKKFPAVAPASGLPSQARASLMRLFAAVMRLVGGQLWGVFGGQLPLRAWLRNCTWWGIRSTLTTFARLSATSLLLATSRPAINKHAPLKQTATLPASITCTCPHCVTDEVPCSLSDSFSNLPLNRSF